MVKRSRACSMIRVVKIVLIPRPSLRRPRRGLGGWASSILASLKLQARLSLSGLKQPLAARHPLGETNGGCLSYFQLSTRRVSFNIILHISTRLLHVEAVALWYETERDMKMPRPNLAWVGGSQDETDVGTTGFAPYCQRAMSWAPSSYLAPN